MTYYVDTVSQDSLIYRCSMLSVKTSTRYRNAWFYHNITEYRPLIPTENSCNIFRLLETNWEEIHKIVIHWRFAISDCLPAIPGQGSMPHLKDYVYSSRCPGLHSELTLTPCFLLEYRCNGPLQNSIPDLWNQNRRIIVNRLIVFVLFAEVIEAWWTIFAAVNLVITGSDSGLRLLWRQTIIEPLLTWS